MIEYWEKKVSIVFRRSIIVDDSNQWRIQKAILGRAIPNTWEYSFLPPSALSLLSTKHLRLTVVMVWVDGREILGSFQRFVLLTYAFTDVENENILQSVNVCCQIFSAPRILDCRTTLGEFSRQFFSLWTVGLVFIGLFKTLESPMLV